MRIENAFTVAGDVCARLCDRVHTGALRFAMRLQGGAVGPQRSMPLRLDCRGRGAHALCAADEGDRPSEGSGAAGDHDFGGQGGSDGAPGLDGGATGEPPPVGDDAGAGQADGGRPEGDAGAGTTAPPPQIGPLDPLSVEAGTQLTLSIGGSGFTPQAVAYADGVAPSR